MLHSVLLKVGDNIVYQVAPNIKPVQEQTVSAVEFNRALPEWESTSKNYLIEKKNFDSIAEYFEDEKITTTGVHIPYEFMEIYVDGTKKYAKFNKDKTATTTNEIITVMPKVIEEPKAEKLTLYPAQTDNSKFTFELNIDDKTGEPKMLFDNTKNANSMEYKLLKSFVIKGKAKGIEIVFLEDGSYEIKTKE